MSSNYNPSDIAEVLKNKIHPSLVMWNRLEGRPRTHHFDRALKAEVRDALWMLTKQWQMGEFRADDAGSPVYAKVHISSSLIDTFKAGNQDSEQEYEHNVPLEVKAEQKKIPFRTGEKKLSIDIRLQMGRYWLKLLRERGLDLGDRYVSQYPFELPERSAATDHIYAHTEIWQQYAAISGRSMDGYLLCEHLAGGNPASDNIGVLTDSQKDEVDKLGDIFLSWYRRVYYQPLTEEDHSWLPDRLEYKFQCSSKTDKGTKNLHASGYYHGHLDWYAFDIEEKEAAGAAPPPRGHTETFIPSHVEFDGMPDTRWWKFEDGKTSFGGISPSTTDLSSLLLIEFGLVFANDWFMIPYTLPAGSLANVEGLTVRNNFGETFLIRSTGESDNGNRPWSLFKMSAAVKNSTLFLAPSAMKVHEGPPAEEILLIRDEMANMVWGIETVIPGPFGKGDKGGEAALRIREFHEQLIANDPMKQEKSYAASVSYLAMTDVPENWIPFIPVHKKGGKRKIQLQRATRPRIIDGDPALYPLRIEPATSILREGLENTGAGGTPEPRPYYIHEEEVPRSGIIVSQAFQRTRWTNGEVYVWLGMKKKTGTGGGNSGLAFDRLKEVKQQ